MEISPINSSLINWEVWLQNRKRKKNFWKVTECINQGQVMMYEHSDRRR